MSPKTKRNLGYALFGIIGVKVLFWSLGPSSHSDHPASRPPVAVAPVPESNVQLSQFFGTWSNVACGVQSFTWTATTSTMFFVRPPQAPYTRTVAAAYLVRGNSIVVSNMGGAYLTAYRFVDDNTIESMRMIKTDGSVYDASQRQAPAIETISVRPETIDRTVYHRCT